MNEIVLIRIPFTNLTGSKTRPAIVVNAAHPSDDVILIPLSSLTSSLLPGEFLLRDWRTSGLNVPSAVKRGLYTLDRSTISKSIGTLSQFDHTEMMNSIRYWLGL